MAQTVQGRKDNGGLRDVRVDALGQLYIANPGGGSSDATAANQVAQTALLQEIADNTDTLEIKAENINLNTDGIETKLDTIALQQATSAKQDDIITAIGGIGAPPTYTTRIDEASATVTYIGDATIGSATSVASWRIKKIDTTSGTSITFADGDGNFDNIWNNRASLTYS